MNSEPRMKCSYFKEKTSRENVVSHYIKNSSKEMIETFSVIYLYCFFLMPQYFGIRAVFFDLTVNRFLLICFLVYIFVKRDCARKFMYLIKSNTPQIFFLLAFMFVTVYTMVLRVDFNSLFNPLVEFLFLYSMTYIFREVLPLERVVKIINRCAMILCLHGLFEYLARMNLFHLLNTLHADISTFVRSGQVRVMGPCGHALGYGLLLIIFVAIACIDCEKKCINILKHKFLMFLLVINIVLTGSRSTLGLFVVEFVLLIFFSPKEETRRIIVSLIAIVIFSIFFTAATYATPIGRYIMLQVTSVIDGVFDTTFSVNYGAEISRLNSSAEFRAVLPKIFSVSWLNPILGRGVSKKASFQFGKIYVNSVDNFYINQYIKYAYPGMFTYIFYILSNVFTFVIKTIKKRNHYAIACIIGIVVYFINLYWVDSLQTLRYVYILFAFCMVSLQEDSTDEKTEVEETKKHSYFRNKNK